MGLSLNAHAPEREADPDARTRSSCKRGILGKSRERAPSSQLNQRRQLEIAMQWDTSSERGTTEGSGRS